MAGSLVDSRVDPGFERVMRLARRALDVPAALVSVVGSDREAFTSVQGPFPRWDAQRWSLLSDSVCRQVIAGKPVVIADARRDPAGDAAPELGVVAYAGVPLCDPDGRVLGALCAIDHRPRPWSDDDIAVLGDLADIATGEIEARRTAAIVRSSDDVILAVASDGVILSANPATARHYGWEPSELIGRDVSTIVPPDRRDKIARVMERVSAGEHVTDLRTQRLHRDGSVRHVSLCISPIAAADGRVVGHSSIARDISGPIQTEELLRDAEERFRSAFDVAPVGIGFADLQGRWFSVNDQLCALTGYSREQLLGEDRPALTHPEDAVENRRRVGVLLAGIVDSDRWVRRFRHAAGHTIWVDLGLSLVHEADGTPRYFVSVVHEVTERIEREEQLEYLATHDTLTGLVNRRHFTEELERHLAHARRYGATGAVLAVDLDRFKQVNDTLGHQAGDELIIATATTLRRSLRDSDIVSRMGGDEFAILLPEQDLVEAQSVATKLIAAIDRQPTPWAGDDGPRVSASVGIAAVAADATVDRLLATADAAMYDAKHAGRGRATTASADGR